MHVALESPQKELRYRVAEIAAAGKNNAWNFPVHTYTQAGTDILILMDADMEFIDKSTLSSMLSLFVDSPSTDVLVAALIQDIQFIKASWK